jgi:hypothetical protein
MKKTCCANMHQTECWQSVWLIQHLLCFYMYRSISRARTERNNFTYHSLCFYQEMPFQIHRWTRNDVDDSTLMYSDESNSLHFGAIVRIIRLKATGDIIFIIDKASIIDYDSFSLNGTKYINDLCIYTTLRIPPSIISINYCWIREKVAYRLDEHILSICEFHIFPNILEST